MSAVTKGTDSALASATNSASQAVSLLCDNVEHEFIGDDVFIRGERLTIT